MTVNLPGFFDLGTPTAPGVNPNTRTTIRVPYGADWTLAVQVSDSNGQPFRLGTDAVVFNIRKRPSDAAAALTKTGTNGSTTTSFAVSPSDVKRSIQPGTYVFDVWITHLSKRSPLIPLSTIIFEAVATPP